MLLSSACGHHGGGALAGCALWAQEKAPTCRRKEKVLCWPRDALLHLATASSRTHLRGQRVGGAGGSLSPSAPAPQHLAPSQLINE